MRRIYLQDLLHHPAPSQGQQLLQLIIEEPAAAVVKNADYVRPEQRVVGGRQKAAGEANERAEGDLDYLDIPAFLRRQTD